jgi:mono/diheme cytochrome c family protein
MRRRFAVLFPVACCLFPLFGCRPSSRREADDFERMRRQQRYNAFDSSGFFTNGATMQAPPAHTIPTTLSLAPGVRPAGFYNGAGDSTDAPTIPITVDSATMARGAEQFTISCAPCHGAGGYGGGIMAANLTVKRPPSLRTPEVAGYAPGKVFKIITDGVGMMPPHGWQMPPETRWAVVAYVRALHATPSTPDTRTDSARAIEIHVIDSLRAAAKAAHRPFAAIPNVVP